MDTQIGVARLRKDDDSMGKSGRKYSREFKLEAVKQVVEQGRPVSEVAANLGVNRNMLTRWKSQLLTAGELAFPGQGRRSEAIYPLMILVGLAGPMSAILLATRTSIHDHGGNGQGGWLGR